MGLMDWTPDGIVLSKGDNDPRDQESDAYLDARDGQLYNVRVQGPAISSSWTGDPAMEVLPGDKLFVVIVADVWFEGGGDVVNDFERGKGTDAKDGAPAKSARKAYEEARATEFRDNPVKGTDAERKAWAKKQYAAYKANNKTTTLTNFRPKLATSSQMINYSHLKFNNGVHDADGNEDEKLRQMWLTRKPAEAKELLPGGVNSPVRAFSSVGGNPIVFETAKGSKVVDADGNSYVDYVGSWGPAICGHGADEVNDALKAQIDKGTSFGAPCELENQLAQMVIDRVPCVEMVRMCNSGTEACLSVLRLMRAYTGRNKIIKFVGCYHGHADAFLVQAGSGVLTLGLPDSPGVPKETTAATLTATYNDLDSVKAVFEANKGEIAGVILEPVVGNSGFIPPTQEFLEGLRSLTSAEGSLLCFDEVMTGFRIAKGCAQEHFGVTPDLTTMGKVIGGGPPGYHGDGRARRADVPGGDALRQPPGDDGRHQDPGDPGAPGGLRAPRPRHGEVDQRPAGGRPRRGARGVRRPHQRDVRDVLPGGPRELLRAGRQVGHGEVRPLAPRHARARRVPRALSV